MEKQRRQFSGQEKVKILREHLLEKHPVSQVCVRHKIEPTLFYAWQKVFFENGAAAFERPRANGKLTAEEKRINQLEGKLQRKDGVMAELMTEHIMLKKVLRRSEGVLGAARHSG